MESINLYGMEFKIGRYTKVCNSVYVVIIDMDNKKDFLMENYFAN